MLRLFTDRSTDTSHYHQNGLSLSSSDNDIDKVRITTKWRTSRFYTQELFVHNLMNGILKLLFEFVRGILCSC
jgi:hypothetical protein